jgi:6-phosphogluconolactonase/glucosamine-6-phosphate isomerase/deaminase
LLEGLINMTQICLWFYWVQILVWDERCGRKSHTPKSNP